MNVSINDAMYMAINLTGAQSLTGDALRVRLSLIVPDTTQVADLGTVCYPVKQSKTGKSHIQMWPDADADEKLLDELHNAGYRVTTAFRPLFDVDTIELVVEQLA